MIHALATPRSLGFVRAWVFGIWFFIVALDPFEDLAALPAAIFEPYGALRLISRAAWASMLTAPGLLGFKVVLVALLGLAAAGVRPYRPMAVAAAIGLTTHQALVRGYGFIQHRELGLLFAAYVLAIFPAADGFGRWRRADERAPRADCSAALTLMTLVLLLAYSATGVYRLAYAAPSIFVTNSLRYYVAYTSFRQNYYAFDFGQLVVASPLLSGVLNAGFVGVTMLEVVAPLCLFNSRLRWAWLAVMCPFHVATLFLMKIFFWQNLVLLVLLLGDIDPILAFLRRVKRKAAPSTA